MQLVGFSLLFRREGYSQQSYNWIFGRGRQEHATYFGKKSAIFSLLAAFIPLLNAKGYLEGWIMLFPSLFWFFLG
jgi:hypothetical protein